MKKYETPLTKVIKLSSRPVMLLVSDPQKDASLGFGSNFGDNSAFENPIAQ